MHSMEIYVGCRGDLERVAGPSFILDTQLIHEAGKIDGVESLTLHLLILILIPHKRFG